MPTTTITPSPGDVVQMADGRRAVIESGNHYGRDNVMADASEALIGALEAV